mmetsp:Transcript_44881/g.81895  ORF Transcript_44881/g.81895 Transcript_44881/m.81895 type:complete len:476 (+) Transcript_44881:66-1493(+)
MGNSINLADNQSISHQGGASRLCQSFIVAFCVAPFIILGSIFALGWNERQAVCNDKVIIEGTKKAHIVDCDSTMDYSGELVFANCDIQKNMVALSGEGDFSSLQHVGTGLRFQSEMLQCVESSHSEKRRTGGGGTDTITTYTYSTEWVDHQVSSSGFKTSSQNFNLNCGTENPSWPAGVPHSGSQYVRKINVGAFETNLASSVPLDTPVQWTPPSGWSASSPGYLTSDKWSKGSHGIGSVRVKVYSNDWDHPKAALLGQNNAGVVGAWMGSSTWLCSGFSLEKLRMGTYTKQEFFDQLSAEESAFTWVVRIVGFAALWIAFAFCLAPLGVAADCIPCIGGCISEAVECVACCVACVPATALCVLVTGIVWLVMRPLLGCGLLVAGAGLAILLAVMGARAKRASPRSPALLASQPLAAPAPVTPLPAAQTMNTIQVSVPPGCRPGSLVQVQTPDGITRQVVVPDGVSEGQIFAVSY